METNKIDKAESVRMIRRAVDNSVNDVDAVYVYKPGDVIVGSALQGGYLERILLAVKIPFGDMEAPEEMQTNICRAV